MKNQVRNREEKNSSPKEERKERNFWLLLIGFGLFIVFIFANLLSSNMTFFKHFNEGNAPFIFYFLNYVFFTGIWGAILLITGIVLPIWGFYMIITGKAFAPAKAIAPVTLLTIFCLGFAYFFLGTGWLDSAADAKTYFEKGGEEKVIVLKDYEIDVGYSRYSGATEYIYTTTEGEKFTTEIDFGRNVYLNEEYVIRYLPKTKYIIEINTK